MADSKDVKPKANPESYIKKAVKSKPAGSVKEWLEILNSEDTEYEFYYDNDRGKILFKKK